MFKRKIVRRLAKLGSQIDESYLLYLNNDEPRKFDTKGSVYDFITEYRTENVIFKLQIFRIETYSL